MLGVKDLRARVDAIPTGEPTPPAVLFRADQKVDLALQRLVTYFGDDDGRHAVVLVVDGQALGLLSRQTVYDLVSIRTKGIGTADQLFLPGSSDYQEQRLRCPVPGCAYRLSVVLFDEDDPPRCAIHRWSPLVLDTTA